MEVSFRTLESVSVVSNPEVSNNFKYTLPMDKWASVWYIKALVMMVELKSKGIRKNIKDLWMVIFVWLSVV